MFGKKELENKIKELEEENAKLKESYGLSKSRELNDEIKSLKKDIEDYHNNNRELRNKLDEVNRQKSSIENDLTNYKNKYDNLVKLKDGQSNELRGVYEEKHQLIEKIEELNKNISVKDIEIEAYKQAIQNISVNFNGTIKNTSTKANKSKGE